MLRKQIVFYIFVNYCIILSRTAINRHDEEVKYEDNGRDLLLGNDEYLVDKLLKCLVATPPADKRRNNDETMKLYSKYTKDCDHSKIISAPLTSFLLNYETLPKLSVTQCKDSTTMDHKAVPCQGHTAKSLCPMKSMKPEPICEDGIMDPLEHGLLMIRSIRQHATNAIKNANELEMEIMAHCQMDHKQCHKPMS